MFYWRITKYDPKNRDTNGFYLKNEWVDYGDIGQIFDGKKFTYKDYIKIENLYIQAVLLFMDCLKIDSLKVISLEDNNGRQPSLIVIDNFKIENNEYYKKEMIVFIIKSILRIKFWCILESEEMRVRFGYDYYMYIACNQKCVSAVKKIEQLGLFVEKTRRELIYDEEYDA